MDRREFNRTFTVFGLGFFLRGLFTGQGDSQKATGPESPATDNDTELLIHGKITSSRSKRGELPFATLVVHDNDATPIESREEMRNVARQVPIIITDAPTDIVTAYMEVLRSGRMSPDKEKKLIQLFTQFIDKFQLAIYSDNPPESLCP